MSIDLRHKFHKDDKITMLDNHINHNQTPLSRDGRCGVKRVNSTYGELSRPMCEMMKGPIYTGHANENLMQTGEKHSKPLRDAARTSFITLNAPPTVRRQTRKTKTPQV